ncbi:MAG TPA: dienelactone hydrolase family protein [Pirellulaceae bacterium]|nr:dienelactone hydrolase family protein [Pirellulaceae bacterium]
MPRLLTLCAVVLLAAGCEPPGPVTIPAAGTLAKLGPGTHKEAVEVPGVGNLKYTIEIPAGYDGSTPAPLVLALHYGYDGAVPEAYTGEGMIDSFRSGLAGLNALVIAPDVLGGDWTDARNEQAAVWLVNSAKATYSVDPKRVIITGYSMGGEGTWFIGSRHQDVFTGAIPVAAPVAGSTDWKIPVYVIHSQADEIISHSAAKRHADAIKSKGGKLELKSVTGLTHYDTGSYATHVGEGIQWLEGEWK